MILKKQLQQMEKEKRDKEMRLKGQEKKVGFHGAGGCLCSVIIIFCPLLLRLTTMSEPRDWWRYPS